ncbi:sensor histidine kinase [Halorussus marinus]|uniref:sensor histidine kinase n=1 Tax=Halorussus marinus TaxID=2505976 RepID=UPI00106F0868|nr:histidine kinase N-terminal 7TM domain-containing protein [Halorussus marinus]
MQFTVPVAASILATVVSLGVAVFAWRRRRMPGAVPLAAFTVATAVWTGGNALQIASTSLGAKLFWVDVQYVGTVVVPLAWFAFACEYAGREEWVTRRSLAVLAVIPAITILLAWTNGYHHLVRTSAELATVGDTVTIQREFGPWFWFANFYSNLVNAAGTVLLLHGLVRSRRLYRIQTLAVLAGTTVPWVGGTLFYNGLIPVEPEVFFGVSALTFALAISKYGLLDIAPVGRHTVVEEMDDPVVVLDDDRIADANPAAADLFGWRDADAAIGLSTDEAFVGCPEFERQYDTDDAIDELSVEDANGREREFDVQFTPLSERAVDAEILLLKDVTSVKRHEAALERQNRRLERVGHTIAHDLRNPLNVAQGHLELGRETDVDVDDHLAKVDDAHDRMDDIIEEVLAMARDDETARRDPHSVGDLAERAWANVETADAALAVDEGVGVVEANDSQLASVFENLFRNAVEHGGPDATVRVGALDDGGFYVADDGPGVPESDREEVFEQGFTTRSDGNGVGLAVVADVADRHDWRVAVTESEAGGARFEFRGTDGVCTVAQ